MGQTKNVYELLSTRIFPKNTGVDSYNITGIAARCDWIVLTDLNESNAKLCGNLKKQPKTVFLSLRSLFHAIPYFYEEVLPKITTSFVLISGSADITIPNQTDLRWRPFDRRERDIIERIRTDKRVIHWFAENRDEVRSKMSSLPIGCIPNENQCSEIEIAESVGKLGDRPLKVFCANRSREGDQWQSRRKVAKLCGGRFSKFCTLVNQELSFADYQERVRAHPFVLCVHGGGIDPSPKAWLALALGSIPIIKSSPLDDAYSQLPVAFVDDWNERSLSEGKLAMWMNELSPYFENPDARMQVLHRLSIDYWWNKIGRMANGDSGVKAILRNFRLRRIS